MPRQVCLITPPQQIKIARAASRPTRKKRKDGGSSVGILHTNIVKGGPPAFRCASCDFSFRGNRLTLGSHRFYEVGRRRSFER